MILWCSYCQKLLGEQAPFDNPAFSHGLCPGCERRLDHDELIIEETAPIRTLLRRILASARVADYVACESILADARALGLGADSLLVGMLQPALYQAGLDWQGLRMSVATEHRFTGWCERVFSMLPTAARRQPPIDLVIFQAPGNAHTVGPRFAAQVLAARGLSAEAIVEGLPFEEMVEIAQQLRPRHLGLSCAMPQAVPVAADLIVRLRERLEPALGARYLMSGFAFRLAGNAAAPTLPPGVDVVLDLGYFGDAFHHRPTLTA